MASRLTICEVHRQMMRALKEEGKGDPETVALLTEAYLAGKAMSAVLKKHKRGWDRGWWPPINKNPKKTSKGPK